MKKILFLGPPFDYYKGGAEYQYKILEQHLKEKYRIYYLFRHVGFAEPNHLTYDYFLRKNYNEYLPSDYAKIYKLINKLSPDLIYKQGVDYAAAIGVNYSKKKNISFFLHIASKRDVDKIKLQFNRKIIFDIFINSISKYVIKNATKIICQALYQNNLLKINYKRNCDLILPNFHPIPRNKIHKNESPIKVLWIANFKKLKQPEIFIALAKKFESDKQIKFVMIGRPASGPWYDSLLININKLCNLEYIGEMSIDQVNRELNGSHILVNTSQYEGFSNTYIQAWMRQVPVVSLNSDPDNILKNIKIGYHSVTFEQLIVDVNKLVRDHRLRDKMGKTAQRFANEKFNTTNINKFEQLINAI